jgi:integrase
MQLMTPRATKTASIRRDKISLNFTKAVLDRLPAAKPGARDYYNDTKIRGLQLAVTDHGAKSFCLYRRMGGRPTRYTLGRYPDLTPENARKKAETIAGRVALGEDVAEGDRVARTRKATLAEVFERFKIVRHRLRPTTVRGYENLLKSCFKDWKDRPIVDITKDKVGAMHLALTAERGPASADGAMRFLRSLLNFANGEYEAKDGTPLLIDNPVRRLSQTRAWHRAKRRTTVIKRDQLKPWFEAVLLLKTQAASAGTDTQGALVADYLLLLILTGLRRSEGAQLVWSDVDLKAKTLTVRDTKNHEDHALPLTDYLFEILAARRKVTSGIFVFPGPGESGHLAEPRPQMNKVVERSGVPFHLHDLRRTFATVAESLDIPAYALKRLLNHKMRQDMTAGYVVADVERLRTPMQRITDFILKSAELRASASVTASNQPSAS